MLSKKKWKPGETSDLHPKQAPTLVHMCPIQEEQKGSSLEALGHSESHPSDLTAL